MHADATIASNRLAGLNDHIRRDALRRLWKLYIVFLVMGLCMSCVFVALTTAGEQEIKDALAQLIGRTAASLFYRPKMAVLLVPLILAVAQPLLALAASTLIAQVEKSVYRLYAVLPLSNAMRGRRIWLRQAVLAPLLVSFVPVTATALVLNLEPTPLRAAVFMMAWRLLFVSLAVPALLLLTARRPLHEIPPGHASLAFLVAVPVALVHYAAFWRFGAAVFGGVSWLLFLAPVLALLAVSYSRASRLAFLYPAKEPAAPWPQEPNAPQSLRSLLFFLTLRSVGSMYILFLVVALFGSLIARSERIFYYFAMDAMAAGICTFALFLAIGRFISEHMRVLRLLPLTPGRIAAAALLYGIGATAITAPAISLMTVIATPGRSPFIIAGAVFLAADAGCFAVALQVRLAKWAVQVNLLLFAVSFLVIMPLSTPIHDQPVIVDRSLLCVALAAFPICLVAGFIAIRHAIKRTSAGVYRDIFLEKFTPQ